MKQLVKASFRAGGPVYTYLNDEAQDVQPGHIIEVITPAGNIRQLTVENADPFSEQAAADLPYELKPCYLKGTQNAQAS